MTLSLKKHEILFIALAGVYVACAMIGGALFFSPIPWYDTWENMQLLDVDSTTGLARALLSLHNEHRILYTRLLFLLDTHLFDGSLYFLIVINYLLVLAAFFLFIRIYKRIGVKKDFIPFVLLALLFLWAQYENFIWEFQSQFFLANLMPLAAYYCLARSASGSGNDARYFYSSALLGVLSSLTMAGGLAALPMLTVGAAVLRLPAKRVAVLAALTGAVCAAYFHGYTTPEWQGGFVNALRDKPGTLVLYTLMYLGNPFSVLGGATIRGMDIAAAAGAVFVVLAVFACFIALKKRQKNTVFFCLALFVLQVAGVAFITSYGRTAFGVGQALSPRYATPAVMAWSALMLIYLPYYGPKKWNWIPFALLLLVLLPYQVTAVRKDYRREDAFELGGLSLMLGVGDFPQTRSGLYPNKKIFSLSDAAKRHAWGFYNSDRMKAMEKAFISKPRIAITGAPGTGLFMKEEPVRDHPEYSSVTGLIELAGKMRSKEIYLLDGEGRVIGVGLLCNHNRIKNKISGTVSYAFKAWLATKELPECTMVYHPDSGTWFVRKASPRTTL